MYQQVCEIYFTSGIIKDKKFDPRNKWRKVVSLKLDTSCYQGLMRELGTSSIYQDLRIQNSQFWILAHDDLNN